MLNPTWSAAEKKVARAAFDRAYRRECDAILAEVRLMLASARDVDVIWRIEEYLHQRRREMNEKYDYRYSVLMLVFMGLYRDGYLLDEDLEGLAEQKVAAIKGAATL